MQVFRRTKKNSNLEVLSLNKNLLTKKSESIKGCSNEGTHT